VKKVLLITYDWLPRGSVGLIRIVRFAKYLIRFGHEVHVLTRTESAGGTISWDIEEPLLHKVKLHRVSEEGGGSFWTSVKERLNPQLELAWFNAVKKELTVLIDKMDFDVIISSSPPESTHYIAALIKKKTGKRWIADLRDLWSHDHYRSYIPLRRMMVLGMEKAVLGKADKIITVSETYVKFLKKFYGGKPALVTNGYDEDWFQRETPEDRKMFRITYMGKLNGLHQDVSVFLKAIKEVIEGRLIPRENLQVSFYISGYGKPDIKKIAAESGLEDVVYEYPPLQLGSALRIIKTSSVLLLVGWKGVSAHGWRSQKVYEYMGSGIPILLVNGSDNKDLINMLNATKSGSAPETVSEIKEQIINYYKGFLNGNYYCDNRELTKMYSADYVTRKLSELIEV